MNIKKGAALVILIAAVASAGLIGCRTTVAFDAVQPAEVNMSQYRTLGIFDFSEYELSRFSSGGYILFDFFMNGYYRPIESRLLSGEVSRYMTSELVRTLDRTDYFTVIPPSQLRNYFIDQVISGYDGRRMRQVFGIDALIVGSIEDMRSRDFFQQRIERVTDLETGERVSIVRKYYVQEVSLEVSYSVVAVDDGRILATKRLDGRRRIESRIPLEEEMPSGWSEEDFSPPSLAPVYRAIIDGFMPEIRDQLAPRTVRQYRSLEKDRTDDSRMDRADDLVKDGRYQEAVQQFLRVWYDTGNYAAGYNASILYEVLGEVDKAVSLMREVVSMTGERQAFRELNRLIEVREQYYRALEQL